MFRAALLINRCAARISERTLRDFEQIFRLRPIGLALRPAPASLREGIPALLRRGLWTLIARSVSILDSCDFGQEVLKDCRTRTHRIQWTYQCQRQRQTSSRTHLSSRGIHGREGKFASGFWSDEEGLRLRSCENGMSRHLRLCSILTLALALLTCARVAFLLRELLEDFGLQSFVTVSGAKACQSMHL